MHITNPRRACAMKIMVVSLCVCRFVCLHFILELQAVRQLQSGTNGFSTTRASKNVANLLKNAPLQSKKTGRVADCVTWSSPSISNAHTYS